MRFVGIDPSTKTGFVILDKHGELIDALEVTATGQDPGRMAEIIHETFANIEPGDIVAIEGFGFASQSGFLLGGIGWGIRIKLYEWGFDYIEVAPSALKKFAGAKGNAKKDELSVDIFKRWGFEHKSDNVRDAYVLAQIARAYHGLMDLTKFQQEVIDAIRNPAPKKGRKRVSA